MNRVLGVPQFTEYDLHELEDEKYKYWFEASMISTCKPLLDDCDSNYTVEDRLKRAKVIDETCHADSETCALVVNFKNKPDALSFIGRLNKYLIKKSALLREAREF